MSENNLLEHNEQTDATENNDVTAVVPDEYPSTDKQDGECPADNSAETAEDTSEAHSEPPVTDVSETEENTDETNIDVPPTGVEEQYSDIEQPRIQPRKKLNKLWIPITFLSAAVVALAIMTGTLWSLLRSSKQSKPETATTTTQPELTSAAGVEDLSEALDVSPADTTEQAEDDYIEIVENGKITYWDSSVGYSWVPVLDGVDKNEYRQSDFEVDADGRVSYSPDGEQSSFFGIDVSSHQQDIDWQLVREDGVEFAFLRIGFRGYGEEGNIKPDEKFEDNYKGASEAGIGVGVYFFSQALTVEEAVEEANYVLGILDGRSLDYPVVFDWETITGLAEGETARTEDVSAQTLTLSAIAFCDTISAAGYKPMIYTNKKQAVLKYDLRKLTEYPIWFAYYDTTFDYCYDFDFWQYGFGAVDGIEGDVDLNVAILK